MELPGQACSLSECPIEDKGILFSLTVVLKLVDISCLESHSALQSAHLTSRLCHQPGREQLCTLPLHQVYGNSKHRRWGEAALFLLVFSLHTETISKTKMGNVGSYLFSLHKKAQKSRGSFPPF